MNKTISDELLKTFDEHIQKYVKMNMDQLVAINENCQQLNNAGLLILTNMQCIPSVSFIPLANTGAFDMLREQIDDLLDIAFISLKFCNWIKYRKDEINSSVYISLEMLLTYIVSRKTLLLIIISTIVDYLERMKSSEKDPYETLEANAFLQNTMNKLKTEKEEVYNPAKADFLAGFEERLLKFMTPGECKNILLGHLDEM